jgi:hypothetical protein
MPDPALRCMTLDEFLSWDGGDSLHTETGTVR